MFFGPSTFQNSNIQIPRDDGLRRGFDALDVEHTGEIPVEKFKERIRKVFRIFNEAQYVHIMCRTYNIVVCYICNALLVKGRVSQNIFILS